MSLHLDERGVVLAWFARVALVLGALALLAFDAGALAVNYFGVDSAAKDIALAASDVGGSTLTARGVHQVAEHWAEERQVKLVAAELRPDGTVFIKVKRKAKTLLAGHIGALDEWVTAKAEATFSPQH